MWTLDKNKKKQQHLTSNFDAVDFFVTKNLVHATKTSNYSCIVFIII